jgi:hypothetical protein
MQKASSSTVASVDQSNYYETRCRYGLTFSVGLHRLRGARTRTLTCSARPNPLLGNLLLRPARPGVSWALVRHATPQRRHPGITLRAQAKEGESVDHGHCTCQRAPQGLRAPRGAVLRAWTVLTGTAQSAVSLAWGSRSRGRMTSRPRPRRRGTATYKPVSKGETEWRRDRCGEHDRGSDPRPKMALAYPVAHR